MPSSQAMKKIEAIIKPFKLDDVKEALQDLKVSEIMVTEIKMFGSSRGKDEYFAGADYVIDFLPKVKIETVVEDDQVEKVVAAISQSAATDRPENEKIMVTDVLKSLAI